MSGINVCNHSDKLNKAKPTLILPCSEEKLPYKAPAFDLYQGQGYLSIVRQFGKADLTEAFNILFISGKYGLISANEFIEPYEQKLDNNLVSEFGKSKTLQGRARSLLNAMNKSAPLFLMVPKLYQRGLKALTGDLSEKFTMVVRASGGIGTQRGHLKRVLVEGIAAAAELASVENIDLEIHNVSPPLRWLKINVQVGDVFRPWLNGVGEEAIYGHPVTICQIIVKSWCGCELVDEAGNQWNVHQLRSGLTAEQQEALLSHYTRYKQEPINTVRLPILALPSIS